MNHLIILLLTLCACGLSAQQLNSDQEKQILEILEEFKPTGAGTSVLVMYKGQAHFYSKGLEDVATTRAATEHTPYRIGGMAKHFTAFGIMLLEVQGLINLDDDIRRYLPELADYGKLITIEHLLEHSSGLPEYWSLKGLTGYTDADPYTSAQSMSLFKNQWELIDHPGESYSFSGTGSFLLAQVISKVSGQSFAEFMEEKVFGPLNMRNTFFVDEQSEPTDLPKSYDSQLQEIPLNHQDPGPAGVVTTTYDMSLWIQNLQSDRVGSKAMNSNMMSDADLNGQKIHDPNGNVTIGQQFSHLEKGLHKVWDYGSMGGFASSIFQFTTEDLSIFSCTKSGISYNGFIGMSIADILLKDKYLVDENQSTDAPATSYQKLSKATKEKILGDYFNHTTMNHRQMTMRNDSLFYFRPDYNVENLVKSITSEKYHVLTPYDRFDLSITPKGSTMKLELTVDQATYEYKKFNKPDYTQEELDHYTGIYFSKELMQGVEVVRTNEGLIMKNKDWGLTTLSSFERDNFLTNSSYFKLVRFETMPNGTVKALSIDDTSYKAISFIKVD